jgi:predicted ATPase/DNA-binding SARP family transcriptional activator
VTLRLFGRPRAVRTETGTPLILPADTLLVVAYLALEGESDREAVAADLWPALERTKGLARLRRQLLLLDEAQPLEAPLVERRDGRLALSLAGIASVDVAAFADDVARGDDAAAVARYAPLLAGIALPWAERRRRRAERAYEDALRRLTDAAERAGDAARAAEYAKQAHALHPLRDETARRAMELMAAAGDRAGAIALYDAFAERLERTSRTVPDAATSALCDRLRAAAVPRRTGLHAYASRFVGRAAELDALAELLARRRVVTLIGAPGVGKTRLASEFALQVKPPRDGIAFVDLTAEDDATAPLALRRALARAAGLSPDAAPDAFVARDLLIVLDTCEHVAGAAAEAVERLIGPENDVRVLATSRVALGVAGEAVLRVDPLTPEDGVALFLDRAAQVPRPLVAPGGDDAALARDAAELCRRLEGVPLAIELAAAQLATFGVRELAAQIDATAGSLDAALAWSFDALGAEERAALEALSAFAGGWDVRAAAAVCFADDDERRTRRVLARLANSSLVVADTSAPTARFRTLQMIADHARRGLERDPSRAELVRDRHARHYAERIGAIGAALRGGRAFEHYAAVEADVANVRAAIARLFDGERDAERAAQTALALSRFAADTGYGAQCVAWLERALAADGLSRATRTDAFVVRAMLLSSAVPAPEAYALFRDALAVAREHAPERAGIVSTYASNAARRLGLAADARRLALAGRADAEARGQRYLAAFATFALANVDVLDGAPGAALAAYERAIALYREEGAEGDRLLAEINACEALFALGRDAEGRERLTAALADALRARNRIASAQAREALAGYALEHEGGAGCAELLRELSADANALGDADLLMTLGEHAAAFYALHGDASRARTLLAAAERERQTAGVARLPRERARFARLAQTLGLEPNPPPLRDLLRDAIAALP